MTKITNKQRIINALNEERPGDTLAIYDERLEQAAPITINRIIDILGTDYTIGATIASKRYIVELAYVDGEIDIMLKTPTEYRERYGHTWRAD